MPTTDRVPFEVDTGTGVLGGWRTGTGPRVLALHGGPGLGYDYLDEPVLELAQRYEVATFQQRGLEPSTTTGELTVAEAVTDVRAVLDGLGWDAARLMGHSWGGHLVVHVAAADPSRLLGVLAVDMLGAVGDGGGAAFGAALRAGVPPQARERLDVIEARENAGEATVEESLEGLSILWPWYFADPATAPPMPPTTLSLEANQRLWPDIAARLPALEAALPAIDVPCGFLAGERSPMPVSASTETAERIPGAWVQVVPDAGHFVWHEAPGCVSAAMDRLVTG